MIRKIIQIDEEKCNGCGACAAVCHEGAIGMRNGKAQLLRDDYCDGLGDCLPACPVDAIHFVEREAAAYDQEAVQKNKNSYLNISETSCGCPGSQPAQMTQSPEMPKGTCTDEQPGRLSQWPVQIKLVPVCAPWFQEADLLIAADCTAYAYGAFHERFIKGRITLIGCPKLDAEDYSEKLTEIFSKNRIRSVTVVRMEVPCCGGIEYAVKKAVDNCGKNITVEGVTLSADGRIVNEWIL